MKAYQTETYGIPFVMSVPSSYEEYAQIHGDVNAALENAISNDVNHNILNKIRAALAEVLVKTGYPLLTTENKKGDVVTVKPDKNWFAKAVAHAGWSASEATAQLNAIAASIGYDISSSRGLRSGPAERDIADAKKLVTAIEAGQSTYDRVRTNLEGRNPGLTIELNEDGTFTAEALAAGLAFERRRIESERKAQNNSLLG